MEKLHTLSVICSMAAALTIGAASAAPALRQAFELISIG